MVDPTTVLELTMCWQTADNGWQTADNGCLFVIQVLYIKNLGSAVKPEHLIHLFGRFRVPGDDPIVCKLMTGKMRGQAFVTCAGENFGRVPVSLY